MTCIIGFKIDGHVYLGGDSAGVSSTKLELRKDPKVFKNGDFIFGFTSSFRMGQLLHYSLKIPKRKLNEDINKYMNTKFINAVRNCLIDGGFAKKENEVEEGGVFLVGYQGRLFKIDNDFQVGETYDDFIAIGAGEDFAMGAMSILKDMDLKPEEKIRKALEITEYFTTCVRAPFIIDYI